MQQTDTAPERLDARDITRLRILQCVREAGRIARSDIAGALGVSPATVTAVASDLLRAGLIEEVAGPQDGSRRGRPRVMLRLKAAAHLVAGLKIGRFAISTLLLDFSGREVGAGETPLPEPCMDPATLAQAVRTAVERTCAASGVAMSALSGVCIGMAGQVEAERNFVHWSSSLHGRNHDLGPLLANALPCPAFVENDANLVAKAEHLFGDGRGLRNFLVVTIEHGVGLGIVLDGRLHRGERGCGAEFGHMKVHLDGALCQCGQRGCLEAYVGDYALLREAASVGAAGAPETVLDIQRAARAGDALAQSVLARAGQMFGMGVANLINLFDPERIILSGAEVDIDHLHSDDVMARIRQGVINVDAPLPEIRVHRWGDSMWAKGAAAYGVEQVSILTVKDIAHAA